MELKRCKQCGEVKPLETFRKYYGGRKGTYTMCKACESINSRAKYLLKKGDALTELDRIELDKINKLYEAQRACGLEPPNFGAGRAVRVVDSLDDLISSFEKKASTSNTPEELTKWLTCELTEKPEYYHDVVYEVLLNKYRKVLRIAQDTMLPVYDETYTNTLNKILERFDEYEELYYK